MRHQGYGEEKQIVRLWTDPHFTYAYVLKKVFFHLLGKFASPTPQKKGISLGILAGLLLLQTLSNSDFEKLLFFFSLSNRIRAESGVVFMHDFPN